jgi:hypothetical protein
MCDSIMFTFTVFVKENMKGWLLLYRLQMAKLCTR